MFRSFVAASAIAGLSFGAAAAAASHGGRKRPWQKAKEAQHAVNLLIAGNCLIYVAGGSRLLVSHRFASPLTLLSSAFGHASLGHLCCNMLGLYSFGGLLAERFGREQFLAFYCSAAAFSTACSLAATRWRSGAGSLGASGAIFAVLGALARARGLAVSLIFLPGLSLPLGTATACFALFDAYCLVFSKRKYFDHAAHLAGLLFGCLYDRFGEAAIWRRSMLFADFFKK